MPDYTGLTGTYDFTFDWVPEGVGRISKGPDGGQPEADSRVPARIFRSFDFHGTSGAAWTEAGIDKRPGGDSYH